MRPHPDGTVLTRARRLAAWVALGGLVGLLCGSASALFLTLLDLATGARTAHPALVWALPVAGGGIGWLYQRFGQPIAGGSALVIDRVADLGPQVPHRLAPMVLVGTVLTHLFGGSAGREGTAVQMGVGLADTVAHGLRVSPALRRALLTAGMAGGFGSVFGTPIAGLVFALESITVGRLRYTALVPALVAALVGDLTTTAWGVGHTHYPHPAPLPLSPLLLGKWVLFAVAVAVTTGVFVALTHHLKATYLKLGLRLPARMAVGGALVVGLWQLVGTDDYLGLGVPTIVRAFEDPGLAGGAFALKLLFTAVTLSAGFLGGEVTPLFFIGAALGNLLAAPLGLPLDLAAGVGLAAVFAAAANAPLALSIMAVELLGASLLPHAVVVGVLAWLLVGHRGIYPTQRLRESKWGSPLPPLPTAGPLRLGTWRAPVPTPGSAPAGTPTPPRDPPAERPGAQPIASPTERG